MNDWNAAHVSGAERSMREDISDALDRGGGRIDSARMHAHVYERVLTPAADHSIEALADFANVEARTLGWRCVRAHDTRARCDAPRITDAEYRRWVAAL